jgi:hypothetical protein
MGRTLLFLGLGLTLCLTTLSATAAGLLRTPADFPLPVDSYHDQQVPFHNRARDLKVGSARLLKPRLRMSYRARNQLRLSDLT